MSLKPFKFKELFKRGDRSPQRGLANVAGSSSRISEASVEATSAEHVSPSPTPAPANLQDESSSSKSEIKDSLIGAFKTLLKLGALVSQGLPTQIPKAVLESVSYIIEIAEVYYQRALAT